MELEWDEAKSDACFQAREFDFLFATVVFDDPHRDVTIDDRFNYGERRYRAVGEAHGRVLVVVYTVRDGRCRVIPARRADRKEVKAYADRKDDAE